MAKVQSPNFDAIYRDPKRPTEERVDDLVARMTLEEKIAQMVYDAPAIERLDIPAYNWWNECLHGVARAGIATVFPQAIGLAASWNADLMHDVAAAISDEARAKHHDALRKGIHKQSLGLTFWTPNINIFRDPRWGRGQETYGECPYLTAQMGVVFVKGLQGDDPKYLKLVATLKHYAVHSGPEPERHTFDARVDERDLRETYLPHFETCVKEGGAYSVMGAYNRTNGEPCCASPRLLQDILRQEWGFDGYVVSDCWAIVDIYAHHRVVETPAEAAALAVKAGCDLNCGSTYPALSEAIEQGLIDEATIDRSVKRLFTARFRLGMFDPPEQVTYAQIPIEVNDSPAHRELALESARESIVLLKNEGNLLPLDKGLESIAVIGPNANELLPLLGNYNGLPSAAVTPLEGIRRKVSSATKVYYARGSDLAAGIPALGVIPSTCLLPVNGDAGAVGLLGEYYDNKEFDGQPLLTRVDPIVDFKPWKDAEPFAGTAPSAVRWSGFLIPPVDGTYSLGFNAVMASKLYLDDELVVERSTWNQTINFAQVELEAGRVYAIRFECPIWENVSPQLLWSTPDVDLVADALKVARRAKAVVLVLGLTPAVEGEEIAIEIEGFRGGDRTAIGLPRPQEELLRQVCALDKPVVLVLLSGCAVAVPWAAEHVPAIVNSWYPGEEGGTAIADVLFGDYNPAGRLPVTFYRSEDDLPPFEDYRMQGRTYRYFDGKPLFPFGYGLSYTEFAYSNLQLSAETVTLSDASADADVVTISVDVQNVGQRAGDEVVQLYISDLAASVPVPLRQLAGFKRIHLAPRETKAVTFTVTTHQLSLIDDTGQRIVEPGTFEVAIGGRQPEAREAPGDEILTSAFEIIP
jgi:beta-glucosidase